MKLKDRYESLKMFLFSCKYVPNSPVKETVDAICKYHPGEKIVIVDSQSADKSYYNFFSDYDNVDILDDCNHYRVPGAFYEVCKRYPDEPYYVNLQDCVIFKKSIQTFIEKEEEFTSFMYFFECAQLEGSQYYYVIDWYRKWFSGTKYIPPNPGESFVGCFGPLFIIKNSLMKKIYNTGVLENIKSTSKPEDETFERVMGIIADQEGYSPLNCNIEGNYFEKSNELVHGGTEYILKYFLGRQ